MSRWRSYQQREHYTWYQKSGVPRGAFPISTTAPVKPAHPFPQTQFILDAMGEVAEETGATLLRIQSSLDLLHGVVADIDTEQKQMRAQLDHQAAAIEDSNSKHGDTMLSVFWIPGYPGPPAPGPRHRPIFSPGENQRPKLRRRPSRGGAS
jgi:hypothetical protein